MTILVPVVGSFWMCNIQVIDYQLVKKQGLEPLGPSPYHKFVIFSIRATGGTRTPDPRITNALLYQLSHNGNLSPYNTENRVQKYCFFMKYANIFGILTKFS